MPRHRSGRLDELLGPGPKSLATGIDSTTVSSGRLLKRVLVGRAMRSDRLGETLLPKRIALPVFASDALSSVA